MPKRFTDTEKWKKSWFRKLTPAEKAAWYYITETCDNVGVFDADIELAEFEIGESIDWDTFIEKTNGNIEKLANGKWWLVDYCKFQHTDLSPSSKSKPIQSYIRLLKKHGLYKRVMEGLSKPIKSLNKDLKERERVKEGVKVKVKERERDKEIEMILLFYKKLTLKTKMSKVPSEVNARLKEGYTVQEAKFVILYKFLEWWDDRKTKTWVNLTTLFRPSHFEEYLSQAEQGLDELINRRYKRFKKHWYDDNMNKPLEERKKLKLPDFKEYRQKMLGEILEVDNGESSPKTAT